MLKWIKSYAPDFLISVALMLPTWSLGFYKGYYEAEQVYRSEMVANAASVKLLNYDWQPYVPTPPIVGGKFVRLEKKVRKPIACERKARFGGRDFNLNDRKLEEKFWELSIEEKRKYPMLLRKRFINAKRKRRYEESRKKDPNRAPQPLPPYDEEMAIIKSDKRNPSNAVRLDGIKFGKVSSQSKIGNKVINLEVK